MQNRRLDARLVRESHTRTHNGQINAAANGKCQEDLNCTYKLYNTQKPVLHVPFVLLILPWSTFINLIEWRM